MIYMPTHYLTRRATGTGFTGFAALSGLEGWEPTPSVAGGLGSMATFAWRCTG
jgi:hypothetical protein